MPRALPMRQRRFGGRTLGPAALWKKRQALAVAEYDSLPDFW